MKLVRLLVWLCTLAALVVPPAATHAAMPTMQAESDCASHRPPPPPDPCDDLGTAKHAAGECCPAMAGSVALLPASAVQQAPSLDPAPQAVAARLLAGLSPAKDPPPPRA